MDAVFVEESMARQFLLGFLAKEAALNTLQCGPKHLDDALDAVSLYTENQRAIMCLRFKSPPTTPLIRYAVDEASSIWTDVPSVLTSPPPDFVTLQKELQTLQASQTSLAEAMKQLQQ